MEIINLKGIVLREYPVKENDKFIHVFTRERGVIEISVRGGRKMISKSAGGTQLFAYSDFSLRYDRGRYYLDSCEIIHLFYEIREDLDRLALADYISEVISYSTNHQKQKKDLMRLLLNIFYFISNGKRELRLLKAIFEMRFMTEIGMMPDIVCCSVCMKYSSEHMCFDLLSTKIYCYRCYRGSYDDTIVNITPSVLQALRHIVFADFDRLFNFRLSDKGMKCLSGLTEKYLLIHLDRQFKTLEFYKNLSS